MAHSDKPRDTTVMAPYHRRGDPEFVECRHCGARFTKLGISRHWDKCKKRKEQPQVAAKKKQPKLILCLWCKKSFRRFDKHWPHCDHRPSPWATPKNLFERT